VPCSSKLLHLNSALIIFASCTSSDPPSSAATANPECDTDLAVTTGGDWGEPYDPEGSADSTGEGVMYEPPGEWAEDPTAWELHVASGTYYRAPRQEELLANGWADATLLVIPPNTFTSAVTEGNATATIAIPMAEYPGYEQENLDFETMSLSWMQTHTSVSFVVSEPEPPHGGFVDTTYTPSLHFYLPTGIEWDDHDDTVVRVFASSRGGIELNGARRNDRTFRLYGPYDADEGPYELDIAPPISLGSPLFYLLRTGFAPPPLAALELGSRRAGDIASQLSDAAMAPDALVSQAAPVAIAELGAQCQDERDNDGDGFGDACDFECVVHPDFGGLDFDYSVEFEHTKNFALIGDGPFCMSNPLNYDAILADVGMSAAQMLNWLEHPSGPRVPPVRFSWGGCFLDFPSLGDALDCHLDPGYCDDVDAYPFAGVGGDYGPSSGNVHYGYTGHVWEAVDNRAAASADRDTIHPVSMAVAIANTPSNISGVVGIAYFPLAELGGGNSKGMHGAAVVLAPDGLDPEATEADIDFAGRRVAHELGHTLGLQHDTAPGGFMGQYGGAVPIVDWDADSLLQILDQNQTVIGYQTQEYAWTQYAPSKWAPRPSGFGHTPCVNNNQCNNGHPGLSCNGGWCS
jgi:hypothetical protein